MRIITRTVICSLCIYIASASTNYSQLESVLNKISELEEQNGVLFTVDDVIERMRAEGVDLEAVFAERGITKSDIENQAAQTLAIARNDPPPDEEEEPEEDYIEGIRAGMFGNKNSVNTASSLSGTSSLIMNMIFNMNGIGAPPTPPPMPVFVDQTPKASWGNWKTWTSCTSSCGGGSQKRYRQCQRSRGTPASCPGSQRQVSSCNTQDCPNQNNWASWLPWGACTKSCGIGQQIRRRFCKGKSCIGDTVQIQKCQQKSCYSSVAQWMEWSSWSTCTRSCNKGFKGRIRRCSSGTSCVGEKSQSTMCNTKPCETKTNLVWQEWSSCSATCGTGIRRRTRPCEYSPAKCRRFKLEESDQCYSGTPCGHWSIWRAWGSCTVSCGLGVKARIRKCIDGIPGKGGCLGNYEDTTGCNSQTCPTWTNWQPWSMCTATCGGGLQRRARYCRNGTTCPGNASEERGCQTDACPRWTNWTTWSDCSSSCGGGTKRITRQCVNGSVGQRGCFGSATLQYACNTLACATWGDWSTFTDCSATCGGGRRAQHRECSGGVPGVDCLGNHQNVESCNEDECPFWSDWSDWTRCSVTCGRGFRSQNRRCSQPDACDGDVENVQLCVGATECPSWTEWSSYSSCSATCGGGQKQRSRYCDGGVGMCGDGDRTQRNGCNDHSCPFLTKWSEWTPCSLTCDEGTRTRIRDCVDPNGGNAKCYAMLRSEQSCSFGSCPVPTTPKPTTRPTTTTTKAATLAPTKAATMAPTVASTTAAPVFFVPGDKSEGESMKEVIDEMEKVLATADPEVISEAEECIVLNVNGDCVDHLEWGPEDKIVDIGNCNLPAFIMQNDKVSGTAELITETKVRYKCLDSWRIRGNKNMECRCRGNKCRPRPKQVPRCIPDIKGLNTNNEDY